MLGAFPAAALGTLGPQTGMRQMVQTRYSYGLYGASVIVLLNMATNTGWTIVSAIVSGQTLGAVSGGSLSWDLGIVIVALLALLVAFMGYRVIHYYERYAWIPALIGIVIMLGCSGHRLKEQVPTEPPEAQTIITFACIVVGFLITWAAMVSDFAVYVSPTVPRQVMHTHMTSGAFSNMK